MATLLVKVAFVVLPALIFLVIFVHLYLYVNFNPSLYFCLGGGSWNQIGNNHHWISQEETNENQWPPTNNVVVVSITAPPYLKGLTIKQESKCFQLYIPFVVGAWRRLGYSTFIIVIGSKDVWFQNGTYLNYVYKTVQNDLDGFGYFHFVETESTKHLSYAKIAQIIRLFAADMEPLRNLSSLYLVTTDADWLPFKDIFALPSANYSIRASIPYRRNFTTANSDEVISELICQKKLSLIFF